MNPAIIEAIISLVEEMVKIAPQAYADFQAIFNNPNPTAADWQALRDKALAKGYAQYVPQSDLPK